MYDDSEYRRKRRAQFLAQGLCPICAGKRPVTPGYKSCETCRAKVIANNKRYFTPEYYRFAAKKRKMMLKARAENAEI